MKREKNNFLRYQAGGRKGYTRTKINETTCTRANRGTTVPLTDKDSASVFLTSQEKTSDLGMHSDKDNEMQQFIEHTADALNVKSHGSETDISTRTKYEDRSPSPLPQSDSLAVITMPDRIDLDVSIAATDEITMTHAKSVDKVSNHYFG